MSFKRSLKRNPLTEKEREIIEYDLTKSRLSFEQIGIKHNLFTDDVRSIATELGLIQADDDSNHVNTSTIIIPSVTSERKTYTRLSDDKKLELVERLEAYRKDEWKGFDKKAIIKEFDIASSTLYNLAKSFDIKLPSTKLDKVSKESVLEKTDIISLSNFINDKVVMVKLDESDKFADISYTIYRNSIAKAKVDFDYETPVADLFKRIIEGKGISELKVYTMMSSIDIKVGPILTKYCYYNKCNLTLVMIGKEVNLITDFNQPSTSANVNWLISKKTVERYLYKCSFEEITDLETLFVINLSYNNRNSIIACKSYLDSVAYLNKFLTDNEDSIEKKESRLIGSIKSVKDGKPAELFNFTNSKMYT